MTLMRRRRLRKMAALLLELEQLRTILGSRSYIGNSGKDYLRERVIAVDRKIRKLERKI